MNIGHFFFNHSSQRNVRELAERQSRAMRRARRQRGDARREREQLTERVEQLEEDLGFLAAILGGVTGVLESKGVATPEDLREAIREADLADGEEDGRVDLDNLRGTTG